MLHIRERERKIETDSERGRKGGKEGIEGEGERASERENEHERERTSKCEREYCIITT